MAAILFCPRLKWIFVRRRMLCRVKRALRMACEGFVIPPHPSVFPRQDSFSLGHSPWATGWLCARPQLPASGPATGHSPGPCLPPLTTSPVPFARLPQPLAKALGPRTFRLQDLPPGLPSLLGAGPKKGKGRGGPGKGWSWPVWEPPPARGQIQMERQVLCPLPPLTSLWLDSGPEPS